MTTKAPIKVDKKENTQCQWKYVSGDIPASLTAKNARGKVRHALKSQREGYSSYRKKVLRHQAVQNGYLINSG